MSTNESANAGSNQRSLTASPLLRLRCDGCGYGASVRKTPEHCPMCGGSAWLVEGWRPWGDLTRDLNPVADTVLAREGDSGVAPGMPRTRQ
jgi:hypothetical protein